MHKDDIDQQNNDSSLDKITLESEAVKLARFLYDLYQEKKSEERQ